MIPSTSPIIVTLCLLPSWSAAKTTISSPSASNPVAFQIQHRKLQRHRKPDDPCRLFARPPKHTRLMARQDIISDGMHSYVEGTEYSDSESEVEAMGGDPFFLTDDSETSKKEEDREEYKDVLANGGDPSFLPGYKDAEEPQFDDWGDLKEEKKFSAPKLSSTSQIAPLPIPDALSVLEAVKKEISSKSISVASDAIQTTPDATFGFGSGTIEEGPYDPDEFDLEEIGGDPAFLAEYEDKPLEVPYKQMEMEDPVEPESNEAFVWDGVEIEDAYFDEYM